MRAATLLVAALLAGCSGAPADSSSWYIDFAGGSDSATGSSPSTAWKHAPGDPNASGRPAAAALKPGDTVFFRPDVPYRGTIRVNASGTAAAPLTFTGLGWPSSGKGSAKPGMGVIDGSDPVTSAAPCASAAACGGATDWKLLTRITHDAPSTSRIALFGASGLYYLSQVPALEDPLFSDDRRRFAATPVSMLDELRQGLLTTPELVAAARSGGALELAFWVRGNEVVRRPVIAVEAEGLRFDPTDINFWDDRAGAVALNGSLQGLSAPGNFLVLQPGVIVARLRPGDTAANLSIGNGRPGIIFGKQSHLRIHGLVFRNLVGARGKRREGLGVATFHDGSIDVEVRGNRFGPALLEAGTGIVTLHGTEDFRLIANRIEDIAFGSGLRMSGKPRKLTVEGNVIRRIGRTAITLFSAQEAVVRGNIVADIRGIHGNGITAYLSNRDVLIEGNCVVGSSRPMTYHGNRTPDVRNGLTIRRNIFVTSPGGQGALLSWGAATNGVLIEGNVLVGPRHGLLMSQSEQDVRVVGNDTSGIVTRGPVRADWVVDNNTETLTLDQALKGSFTEDGCEVPASRLGLKIVRSPA
jgi:hypothetical protein